MKKQSSCPSALNREETGYSAQIGPDFFIREATLADAAIIWQTIYDNRVYLRTWLPFVHLCEWAVSERGMNSIRIRCAAGNAPSNAIPRRLGFTLEGVEREGELMADGQYVDLNVYSILKREIENW